MNDEKLLQLNELSNKIKTTKTEIEKIDITACTNRRVRIPEELRDVFFTLLKDYYQKQLHQLEKEEELRDVFFTLLKDYYQKQLHQLEKEFEEM